MIEYGQVTVDSEARKVYVEGKRVELAKLEFDLLEILMSQPTRVVRRGELQLSLRGASFVGEDNLLDATVYGLRVKLGHRRTLIRTVRGVGYSVDDEAHRAAHHTDQGAGSGARDE